jgi:hypothetical protein
VAACSFIFKIQMATIWATRGFGRECPSSATIRAERDRHFLGRKVKALYSRLAHWGTRSYIATVNRSLIQAGVIQYAMTAEELWSVTDVHVPDLPFSIGGGLSIRGMKTLLPDYTLDAHRSYSFFGAMLTDLPSSFRNRESELSRAHALDGYQVGAIWRRRSV